MRNYEVHCSDGRKEIIASSRLIVRRCAYLEKLAETESLLKSCSTQLQQVQHKHETEQRAHLVIIKTLESELDKVVMYKRQMTGPCRCV